MSDDVRNKWFYKYSGRDIFLYRLLETPRGFPDQLGRFDTGGTDLIYPDEDITNGLRIEYTAIIEPFAREAWEDLTARASGITISFSGNDISDSASGFGDFAVNDTIRVRGSASNDGDYIVTTAAAGTLACSATTFTTETASESITIFQVPAELTSPDEASHVNLNRLLSLAVVDYIKAQLAGDNGNLDLKEYYMKEFYKKVGDNESNKRKSSVCYPAYPYAVR